MKPHEELLPFLDALAEMLADDLPRDLPKPARGLVLYCDTPPEDPDDDDAWLAYEVQNYQWLMCDAVV